MMFLYAVGSLLFALGMLLAVGVIAANLAHYRAQMVAALRTLSLDSVHAARPSTATASMEVRKGPVRSALRPAL